MKIFEPIVDEGFEWINCVNDEDYERFRRFDGTPLAENWQPVPVLRLRADDNMQMRASDFPWLGSHALVMRSKATIGLRDILDQHGEILPLTTDDKVKLSVFNARCVDALDEEKSKLTRFSESGRIMWVERASFIAAKVSDLDIFRLPHRASSTYVSQRFVDRVRERGLTGLIFKEVWENE